MGLYFTEGVSVAEAVLRDARLFLQRTSSAWSGLSFLLGTLALAPLRSAQGSLTPYHLCSSAWGARLVFEIL